jgi:carbonic anhydrase
MTDETPNLSAQEALARLQEGNRQFASESGEPAIHSGGFRRVPEDKIQSPFAIILGCSDSRVPAELVFYQGLGDLFVIRVAGNIVAPSQVGSVEFAASQFGAKLVVVLGHSNCGAVHATIEQLEQPEDQHSENIRSIVNRIRPAVEPLVNTGSTVRDESLMRRAVRANLIKSVHKLRHGSNILEQLIADHGLLIIGAEYSLETGTVEFLPDI